MLQLYKHIIYIHAYIYTCWIHIDAIIKTSEDFFKNTYLSLYLKGLCVWEGFGHRTKTATYSPPQPLWTSLCVVLVPLDCSTGGLEAHSLLNAGFLYRILSPTGLPNSLGVPNAPSAGWWLSLLHQSPTRLYSNSLTSWPHRVI